MNNNLYLVYVNPIGKDSNDLFQYEFFFSETPEIVWGEDWNVACPSACENTLPDPETYSVIKILKTPIPLFCVQENSCFSIQDAIDKLIFLAYYENDEEIIKFDFGENFEKVKEKINGKMCF